jgi:hypothetical protein
MKPSCWSTTAMIVRMPEPFGKIAFWSSLASRSRRTSRYLDCWAKGMVY